MSKKRWLASFVALALATQISWGQTPDEAAPGEGPVTADAPPPPPIQSDKTDPNWFQLFVDECLKNVVMGWSQGACPGCPMVRAITIDPFGNAARQIRMVVQYSSNGNRNTTPNMPCPMAGPAYPPPPCPGSCGSCEQQPMFGAGVNSSSGVMGNIVLNERNFEVCRMPYPMFMPGMPGQVIGWNGGFPCPVNAGCERATSGCCGNCSCKSCSKCGSSGEAPWSMQMPPFAMPHGLPGYAMGPVLQHALPPFPYAHPWMGQFLPPMMHPGLGPNAEWANGPMPQWLEWNHPVVWTRAEEPTQAVYEVVAKNDAVYLTTPNLEAKCQRITYIGNRERVILEGDVRLVNKKGGEVTRIEAPRILVDLAQGTFTVEAGKGNGCVGAAPCCPGPCTMPPMGPIGTWGEFFDRMSGCGAMPPPPQQQQYVPVQRSDR